MTEREAPRGVTQWLWIAAPLVVQLLAVGLGIALIRTVTDLPAKTNFYNLPQAIVLFVAYVIFLIAILVAARRFGRPTHVLAVRRTPLLPAVALTAMGLAAGFAIAALLEPIFHGAKSQNLDPGPFPGTMTAAIAIAISAVTVIIGAALTEELYFRGLLYGQLAARYGAAAAIAGSAGIFGLAHFQPDAFPTLFALGLILAYLRLRTASFWPGFALHAINNAAAFSVALLA